MSKETKSPNLDLNQVIANGNLAQVQAALDQGALVINDATYGNGNRNYFSDTLARAMKTRNAEIVDLVLLAGAEPSSLPDNHPIKVEMEAKKILLDENRRTEEAEKIYAVSKNSSTQQSHNFL